MRTSWLLPVVAAAAAMSGLAAAESPMERNGSVDDRGSRPMVGLNKTIAAQHDLMPVVQFLTFIQDRRQDPGHLLFVRMQDIDDLAASSGEEASSFLSRLDQLGVIISSN